MYKECFFTSLTLFLFSHFFARPVTDKQMIYVGLTTVKLKTQDSPGS